MTAAVAGYLASAGKPNLYEATSSITLALPPNGSASTADLVVAERLAETYADVATQRPTLQRVIDRLGWSISAAQVADRISVRPDRDDRIIEVVARDGDADRAAMLANEVAREFGLAVPEMPAATVLQAEVRSLMALIDSQLPTEQTQLRALTRPKADTPVGDDRVVALRRSIVNLVSARSRLEALAFASSERLQTLVIAPAVAPTHPVSPDHLRDSLLAGVLGLLLVTPLALYPHFLNDRFLDAREASETLGIQILGDTKSPPDLDVLGLPYERAAGEPSDPGSLDAARSVSLRLALLLGSHRCTSVALASPDPSTDTSAVTVAIAASLAQSGRRVLLIDADVKRPGVHTWLGCANEVGLSSLAGYYSRRPASVVQQSRVEGLSIITRGPRRGESAVLPNVERLSQIMEQVRPAHDLIVVRNPSFGTGEGHLLATASDAVTLVLDLSVGSRAAARASLDALRAADALVLGAVMVSHHPVPATTHMGSPPPDSAKPGQSLGIVAPSVRLRDV